MSRHVIETWPWILGLHWELTEENHWAHHHSWTVIASGHRFTRKGAHKAAQRASRRRRKAVARRDLGAVYTP